jgi:signal transduction histidine kinase
LIKADFVDVGTGAEKSGGQRRCGSLATVVLERAQERHQVYAGEWKNNRLCQSRDDSEVIVTIADTGIGMTDGELARIFEAFAQGEHIKDNWVAPLRWIGVGSRDKPETH